MKGFFPLIIAGLIGYHAGLAQQASNQFAFNEAPDRSNILRASMALHESEERLFWPIYEQYEIQLNDRKESTLLSMKELVSPGQSQVTGEKLKRLLENQHAEIALKKEYFQKIFNSTNGTVALQFLQGEALYDLLLKSKIYESSGCSELIWSPEMLTDEKRRQGALQACLAVGTQDTARFRRMLEEFEFEYSRIVGHEFLFFEYYIDNAEDWTPRQCKMMGDNFLGMQINEVKTKDRFFRQFADAFDPAFAARLISLHEYMSIMSKMKVWSDNVSLSD